MGRASGIWGKEKCIRAIVEQPEEKRPPERLTLRWEENTKMDLKETGWVGVDWFHLAQDRDKWQDPQNIAVNPQVP
jgi:hypothetical protein